MHSPELLSSFREILSRPLRDYELAEGTLAVGPEVAEPDALARRIYQLAEEPLADQIRVDRCREGHGLVVEARTMAEDAPTRRRDAHGPRIDTPSLATHERQLHAVDIHTRRDDA